jgi:hypothetical protein
MFDLLKWLRGWRLLVRLGPRQTVAEGALIFARRIIAEQRKVIERQKKMIEELSK